MMPFVAASARSAKGVVVPWPAFPPKYALPVVVAPPLMVRPPIAVPLPMVEDASEKIPPESVESPVTPSVPEIEPLPAVSVPIAAVLVKKLVDEAVVAKNVVDVACWRLVFPVAVSAPAESVPIVAALEKRFDDDAVVEKKLVAVALPSVVFCASWYATEVVEWPRPTLLQKLAEVVENDVSTVGRQVPFTE